MKTYRFLPLLLSAGAVFAGSLNLNAATSDPVGAVDITAPAGTVAISVPFVNPIEYQGQLTGASSTTVTVLGADFSAFSSDHYIEFLDGGFEGNMTDIVSTSGDTITVAADVSALAGTEIIAIRQHVYLSQIFPAGTLSDLSDTIYFFNDSGAGVSLTPGGVLGETWVDPSTFGAVPDPIIRPGQGLVVTGGGFSVTLYGSVKLGPTVVPLEPNTPYLLGTFDPVNDLSLDGANIQPILTALSDVVIAFSGDGAFSLSDATPSGGFVGSTGWVDSSFTEISASDPFFSSSAAFYVSSSAGGDWVVPAVPYTP
jgi:hypothetical protein